MQLVSKTFLPYTPKQSYLLPPSPMEWLRENHAAYFVMDVVTELDLSPIYAHYERELRGKPPHDPRMMVALLLYGYCKGVTSSRQLEARTYEDVAFRVIAGGTHPDHVSISEFRRVHLKRLEGLFVQVLRMCDKAGLVKLGHVALDGTKIKANASKHKAMSYARMQEQEAALRQKVAGLLARAEQHDTAEDREFGKDRRGDEMPEELSRAKTRLAKIREVKRALEEEARAAHEEGEREKAQKKRGGGGSGGDGGGEPQMPHHRVPSDAEGNPTHKAQRNFTDPDSRIMVGGDKSFVQAYNAQAVVDDTPHQIIVACALTNQPPDAEHALPMLALTKENCGRAPASATADAGYWSDDNALGVLALGIDPFIATGRFKHGESPPKVRGRPPRAMPVKAWMARRLATKKGNAIYRRRKATVEPVFGQIKHARGFRQFHLRGRTKAAGEWSLVCTAHNLCKLHSARARGATAPS